MTNPIQPATAPAPLAPDLPGNTCIYLHRYHADELDLAGFLLLNRAYKHVTDERAGALLLSARSQVDFVRTFNVGAINLAYLLELAAAGGFIGIATGDYAGPLPRLVKS